MKRLLLAVALAAALPAARAAADARIDARESITFVHYQGGFAIAGNSGDDGSATPVTTLAPPTLGIDGRNDYVGAYLSWNVEWHADWNLTQTWAMDAAAHTISGSGAMQLGVAGSVVGPNCNPCLPSMLVQGRNSQALEFNLDEATAFQFHSETTPDQWLDLLAWNESAQRWFALWTGGAVGQGNVFDTAGVLQAGRYRLQNNTALLKADGGLLEHDVAWNYTLTLPDATISAVPEPRAGLLLAAGVLLLAWRRRPRP
jgi:hypothetical protein